MNTQSYRKSILNALIWDTGFALIPTALMYSMNPGMTWARLLAHFGFSWVYSNCIGGVAFFLIPKFGWHLVSCRLGFAGALVWGRYMPLVSSAP